MINIMNSRNVSNVRSSFKISNEDNCWLLEQTDGVRILWLESVQADPMGTGANLKTRLKKTAFWTARQTLESYGAFRFERVCSGRDGRETVGWRVYNLHGANNKEYWLN